MMFLFALTFVALAVFSFATVMGVALLLSE